MGRPKPWYLVAGLALPIAILLVVAAANSSVQDPRQIIIHASGPRLSYDEIVGEADLIVRVRAGDQSARWNSADNRSWVAEDDHGPAMPLIYTTTEMEVLEVLKGGYREATIAVTTVGGSVGNDRVVVESLWHPKTGGEYIVALGRETVPMREGEFEAWLPVSLGQGLFEWQDDGFRNNAGITAAAQVDTGSP